MPRQYVVGDSSPFLKQGRAVVIVISVFILLSFLGLLFYASVVYHQHRTGSLAGTYIPTVNPEMHNLVASNTSYPRIADRPAPLQFAPAYSKTQEPGQQLENGVYPRSAV
ncbi:uncharacterized protein P884DRAFT_331734 [Thermothelomyces heterothallicus CBS 202.75]|uniref:uncharacterized protein n=1 Tax=Thermothelomyces heterothallicus CBS 202.75 TaxID=1149848 RepID=UPI0037436830